MKPSPFKADKKVIDPNSNEGQNQRLYEYLEAGNTIDFLKAKGMGIGLLSVRIEELRKRLRIYSRRIRLSNVLCEEYRLHAFD